MKNRIDLLKLYFLFLCLTCPLFCGEVLAQSNSSIAMSKNSTRWNSDNGNQKSNLETSGKITISDDEKSISSISPGGYLKIERTTFGNSRKLFITNKNGTLDYEYNEGGRTKPFEPDGKIWLSEILPELLNTTTIGAEGRVDRLYAKGGTKAVLDLLSKLKSDHVKSGYISILLEKKLSNPDMVAVIDAVPSYLDSDHYKYEVYKKIPASYFQNVDQLSRVVSNLDSDHFRAQLLKPIYKADVLNGQGEKALQLLNLLDSDHFKADIAKSIPFDKMSDQDLRFVVDDVIRKFDSDHFKNDLLKSIVNAGNFTEARALIVLSGVKSMQSDHFKSEILRYVCGKQGTARVKEQIRKTAKTTIQSSHFLGEVMRCAA
ncbi:hypothetical protein [Algoriphagus jejuensis]